MKFLSRGAHRFRGRCPLASVFLRFVVVAAALTSRCRAQQSTCGATSTSSTSALRVESLAGVNTLRGAVNCTEGGEVTAVWSGVITLDGPISIGAGTFLSLTGEDDSAEASGGQETRLFEVSPGAGLTLTSLRLSGGSEFRGGAIFSYDAALTLDSCVFDGNTATGGDGGAVLAEGGLFTIIGGEFVGNSASEAGGAVRTLDSDLIIKEGTRFESNRALEGGALYCAGADDVATSGLASCSLRGAVFVSNNASRETEIDFSDYEIPWGLTGGGAVFVWHAEADVTDCVFRENWAQVCAGGLFGGNLTDLAIEGCTFENNFTPGYGGAITAVSATIGGDTVLFNNSALRNGGAVFGLVSSGTIEWGDVTCHENTADRGGCFYTRGGAIVTNGTIMRSNVADSGGCIYCFAGSNVSIDGGQFTECRSLGHGGFMYASDGSRVTISDGLIANNVAEERAAAVYCSGDSADLGGSQVTINGGIFRSNTAEELGGVLVAWGSTTVVTITGGSFSENRAKFYGGFIFLEEEASLTCQDANIRNNYAGDQGGGIYARNSKWVNSTCDLVANESPQGAAAYLTYVRNATFENLDVIDNVASGGSVVYVAYSSVEAKGVTFESTIGLLEDSSNRAIQLDSASSLEAEDCVFAGWLGDTVLHSTNPVNGSLVLNRCDFTRSSAAMAVISPYSDAEIRNAVFGDLTLENAALLDGAPSLVDNAVVCSDSIACGPGACVDSALGVMCECFWNGECLDDGGAISVAIQTVPSRVTVSPDPVSFEVMVSAAADGTTYAVWDMTFAADDLELVVVPSSGVLPPGGNVTVTVTGTPLTEDVGGDLSSQFLVVSPGGDTSDATEGVSLEVVSTFYLCRSFEFAVPVVVDAEESIECEPCAAIMGTEGVDCDNPGATLASLPVREGYWRSGKQSQVIHSCSHGDACAGATQISGSDDYCAEGYKGPYCAVCSDGYGRGIGNTCHSCSNTTSRWLIAVGSIVSVFVLLSLLLAVVFLIGGLDAVGMVRRSVAQTFSVNLRPSSSRASKSQSARATEEYPDVAPAFNMASEAHRGRSLDTTVQDVKVSDRPVRSTPLNDTDIGTQGEILGARSDETEVYPGWRAGRSFHGALASVGVAAAAVGPASSVVDDGEEEVQQAKSGCCGLGERIKRWVSRLPLDKLKILIVVWQILTVFPSITGVDFPSSYSRFLSWIDVLNLDMGHFFSASCVLPAVNFYQSLLVITLVPIGLAGVLMVTFKTAKRRAGIGSAGIISRRAAWSRHMAAGLLLTFLVFTSTSTTVFKTFACDDEAVAGESFLRADYTLSCKTETHTFFRVYAGLMILVYPVGIPLLYAFILWTNRESLNPRIQAPHPAHPGHVEGAEMQDRFGMEELADDSKAKAEAQVNDRESRDLSEKERKELDERIRMRKQNPDLVPSMFLWKDFGPDMYYYEVIECGRRILLTGVLIFVAPNSPAQAAMACIFAFASLLGFELLRPHLDPADSWLYRLGCVVIFLSNFLALLIKVDAAGEGKRSTLGGLLVALNVGLALAVILTSWFATQQSVDDSRDDENMLTVAKTMVTAERLAETSARLNRDDKASASWTDRQQGAGSIASSSSMSRGRPRSGVNPVSGAGGALAGGSVAQGGAREKNVSAAMVEGLWRQDKAQRNAGSS